MPDALQDPLRLIAFPMLRPASRVVTAADGDSIYFSFRNHNDSTVFCRVIGSTVQDVWTVPAWSNLDWNNGLIAHGSDVFLAWLDAVVYTLAQNSTSNAAVCLGPPREIMPRVTRGTTTSLAAWIENRPGEDSLFVSLLDSTAQPLTAPLRVDRHQGYIGDAVIAFDGANFLIVWERLPDFGPRLPVRAQFISQSGHLVGDAFDIPQERSALSLVWTGTEYWLIGQYAIARIDPSGNRSIVHGQWPFDAALLARDAADGRLRGLALELDGAIVAAGFRIRGSEVRGELGSMPTGAGASSSPSPAECSRATTGTTSYSA